MYYVGSIPIIESDLRHYGIAGMKWGVRRYQNEDGTLTDEGRARYAKNDAREYARAKMATGKGSRKRRKMISATVEERSKDPKYKEAFDQELYNRRRREDMVRDIPRKIRTATRLVIKTLAEVQASVMITDMFTDGAASAAIKKGVEVVKSAFKKDEGDLRYWGKLPK